MKEELLYGKGRNVTHLIRIQYEGEHYFSGDSYCGQHITGNNISKYVGAYPICEKCIKIKEKLQTK